jgi:hypothetical protein
MSSIDHVWCKDVTAGIGGEDDAIAKVASFARQTGPKNAFYAT